MSAISSNGKFINLDGVKVYYNRKDNTIQIISSDDDLVGKPFQITLKQGTESEATLRELLYDKGVIKPEENKPVLNIPKFIPYPTEGNQVINDRLSYTLRNNPADIKIGEIRDVEINSTNKNKINAKWNEIPLGIGQNYSAITWDVSVAPHGLICGSAGSGKSVLQRDIFMHCLNNPNDWRFFGIDLKKVELAPYKKFKDTVIKIGTTLEDSVDIVNSVKEIMEKRYVEMEAKKVTYFKDLKDKKGKSPYAIMLMVDEAFMLLSLEGIKTKEGQRRDQLHGDAAVTLNEIARLGRAAGIHLVLATQRPDATIIKGELKANLDTRIAVGRLDATPSSMVLDSDAATQLSSSSKGRSIIRSTGLRINGVISNSQIEFQIYFSSPGLNDETIHSDGKTD
jgi:hypothetical protein